MAKNGDCWGAGALISRVKHVPDGQDVGDLELSEPLLVTMSRHARGSAGRPLGAPGWFPASRFAPTR